VMPVIREPRMLVVMSLQSLEEETVILGQPTLVVALEVELQTPLLAILEEAVEEKLSNHLECGDYEHNSSDDHRSYMVSLKYWPAWIMLIVIFVVMKLNSHREFDVLYLRSGSTFLG
jgi:hypothetical protein